MKKGSYIVLFLLLLCNAFLFAQTEQRSHDTCRLLFKTAVNNNPFSFDSTYRNHSGEAFKVRSFKYYVSHICLFYDDNVMYDIMQPPHLVNAADSSTQEIRIAIPRGYVTGIKFLLGIDSITNTNGVQSEDLDPARGMFWIWNTGYIMAKLEGSSPASKAPGKQYSYDIGGYKPGENTAREILLSLPPASSHQLSTFLITADIAKWFYGKNEIRISEQPMCHSPGILAMQVADNYAAMFSIRMQ